MSNFDNIFFAKLTFYLFAVWKIPLQLTYMFCLLISICFGLFNTYQYIYIGDGKFNMVNIIFDASQLQSIIANII